MTPTATPLAVVTGASRGIGAAVAERLLREGFRVVRLARTLHERADGARVDVPCDVTDAARVRVVADLIRQVHGVPDVLVSGAGTFRLAPFEETTTAEFDAILAANLRGPWLVAHAFVPMLRAAGRGVVVHIGSIADHAALPGNAAYAASKFGLRGLHETLQAEYAGSGVRFTLVSPGPTDTTLWDEVNPDAREGFIPRARMLRPDDVAEAVCFAATRPPNVRVDTIRLGPA